MKILGLHCNVVGETYESRSELGKLVYKVENL